MAIRLKPDCAEAHCSLADVLLETGSFREALAEYRRGDELGHRNPRWPYPSARWLREAEAVARLNDRLPAFLAGRAKPGDAAERLALARLCRLRCKALYTASARFYAGAFAAQPKRADDMAADYRYHAACAAAMAAWGRGKDQPPPDESKRRALRQQALDWLRADLASGRARAQVEEWRVDPRLAAVRGAAALARLPEAERDGWRKLWQDVNDTLGRPQGQTGGANNRK